MSKYFDQTFKTGDVGTDPEKLQITGIDKFLETVSTFKNSAPGLAASGDLGESRLGKCRKMKIPAVGKLLGQFGGGPALEAAEESYRALRTRLLRARSAQGLRSVVVTSATPGEGKTLTSLNLSLCCAQLHDLRVLLIDADIRTSGLSRTLGFPPGPGLVDVLSGKCEPRDAILATDIPNLYALGSGSHTTQPAELFASSHWQEFISWCSESFKLVLIDSPPVLNLTDVELIAAACDGVVMVVRAQHAKREVLQKCAGQIDPKKLLGVVYNAVESGAHDHYSYGGYTAARKEST